MAPPPRLVNRRTVLQGGALLGFGALLAACGASDPVADGSTSTGSPDAPAGSAASGSAAASGTAPAKGSGQVIVTSSGGSYEDAWRKVCWDPFTKETGIEVVPTVAKSDKLLAMLKSGNIEIDVLDNSEFQFMTLMKANGVQAFDYDRLSLTKKSDLLLTADNYAGSIAYAAVACYNTEAVTGAPKDWADIWDTSTFTGKRAFPDIASGSAFLEQALLAAGVPMDKLYPLDLDKAFAQFSSIKGDVPKFFTSGAESTQLFDNKTAVIGGTWNSRIQDLITAGKPFAIQWNQSERLNQGFGLMQGAPNADNAYRLIDYSLQPEVLAGFAKLTGYGPLSTDAYKSISADQAALLPTSPDKVENQFSQDPAWWSDNLAEVQTRWQRMLLS